MRFSYRPIACRWLMMISLLSIGATAAQALSIGPAEGKTLVAQGALLVDVRTPEEFSTGHVEGAINIPHLDVEERLSEFGSDKDREIVLYCRSGNRSGLAQENLRALGYTRVFNAGGYENWISAGD